MGIRLNSGKIHPLASRRFAVLPIIILVALGADGSPAAAAQKPSSSSGTSAPTGQVAATGALSARTSRKGEQLRFWITVSNRTSQSICDVAVMVPEAAGYASAAVRTSIGANVEAPECPQAALLQPDFRIAAGLRPGQSATVHGDLDAVESHDTQTLAAVVSWETPAGISSQITVVLGQNSIESGWQRFGRGAYEVIKDFALPLLLVVITLLFGWWDKKKESARKEAEEVRTWQAETWKQMLPISHRMATKHYTRIGESVREALDLIETSLGKQDAARRGPSEHEAFFSLMLLGRQMEVLVDQVGGLFFKDRVGEKLAGQCWNDYLEGFYGPATAAERKNYQRSIEAVSPTGDGKDGFLQRLNAAPAPRVPDPDRSVWACWLHFQAHYGIPEGTRALFLLRGFGAVLDYEMNRPYEHWYRHPEKLVTPKDAAKHIDVEQLLNDVAKEIQKQEGQDSDFRQQAKDYIAKGKAGKGEGANS